MPVAFANEAGAKDKGEAKSEKGKARSVRSARLCSSHLVRLATVSIM